MRHRSNPAGPDPPDPACRTAKRRLPPLVLVDRYLGVLLLGVGRVGFPARAVPTRTGPLPVRLLLVRQDSGPLLDDVLDRALERRLAHSDLLVGEGCDPAIVHAPRVVITRRIRARRTPQDRPAARAG